VERKTGSKAGRQPVGQLLKIPETVSCLFPQKKNANHASIYNQEYETESILGPVSRGIEIKQFALLPRVPVLLLPVVPGF
jgi:hypothetical protein